MAVQIGALLWATVRINSSWYLQKYIWGFFYKLNENLFILDYRFEQPAIAVTGENNYDIDLNTVIIKLGIIAVWYFLIMPVSYYKFFY